MTKPNEIEGLSQFTGTENYYFNPMFPQINYTDGVKYLAETAGAYWLLDAVFSHAIPLISKGEEFLTFKLIVDEDNNCATLICDDGNDNVLARQEIEFTDFPALTAEIWVENNVAYLPSEH